jgi:DNA-binding GntR family transcriptional regulator
LIIEGQLRAGEQYSEIGLASALDISRSPLREALRRLQHDGFVVKRPGKGMQIANLSRDDLKCIYPIMAVLEALSAQLAAERISATDLQEMGKHHEKMKSAVRTGDTHTFFTANMKFHDVYIQASENVELSRMVDTLRGRIHRFRLISLSHPGRLKQSQRQHQRVLQALANRNGRLAERVVRSHLLDGMHSALAMVESKAYHQGPKKLSTASLGDRQMRLNDAPHAERSMLHDSD